MDEIQGQGGWKKGAAKERKHNEEKKVICEIQGRWLMKKERKKKFRWHIDDEEGD